MSGFTNTIIQADFFYFLTINILVSKSRFSFLCIALAEKATLISAKRVRVLVISKKFIRSPRVKRHELRGAIRAPMEQVKRLLVDKNILINNLFNFYALAPIFRIDSIPITVYKNIFSGFLFTRIPPPMSFAVKTGCTVAT